MTDDELLEGLVDAAKRRRAEEAEGPDWEAVARGDVEAEALAGEDPLAVEIFRPLDAEARARTVDRLASLVGGAGAAAPAAPPPREEAPSPPPEAGAPGDPPAGARVIPLRPRWGLRLGAAAALLAAAAALIFVLRPSVGPIAPYALEVAGGQQAVRADGAAPRLAGGATLRLSLRPAEEVTGVVAARAWLVGTEVVELLPLAPETAPGGALRLAGALPDPLAVPAGAARLAVAVGRPGHLPLDAEEVRAALAAPPSPADGWVLLAREVEVAPR